MKCKLNRKERVILFVVVILEICVLIWYLQFFQEKNRDYLQNIQGETLKQLVIELIQTFLPNVWEFVSGILVGIITLLGTSLVAILNKFRKSKLNWKNRKSIKYSVVSENKEINYKEMFRNYFRFIFEIIGMLTCLCICGGIAYIIVFSYSNVEIDFLMAIAILISVSIIKKFCNFKENRFLSIVFYGGVSSIGFLYLVELYIRNVRVIIFFAFETCIAISIIIYYVVYHFLLSPKVMGLPTWIFICSRGILLSGYIAGIYLKQYVYDEIFKFWIVLLLIEYICQIWIYENDLNDVKIKTTSGDIIKAKKKIIQYNNERIGYIDDASREVIVENKIIDCIYYQHNESKLYMRWYERKKTKVDCFIKGEKSPLEFQKYRFNNDWVRLNKRKNEAILELLIPIDRVEKIVFSKK